jgi:hypothetical protein
MSQNGFVTSGSYRVYAAVSASRGVGVHSGLSVRTNVRAGGSCPWYNEKRMTTYCHPSGRKSCVCQICDNKGKYSHYDGWRTC